MRIGTKGIVGAVSIAVLMTLPAGALAVFPGENGKIAFVSGQGGPANDDSSADVFILDGPLGPVTPLTTDAGQHRHPSWSPDLTTIAYARWVTNNEKIFIDDLSVGGTVQERLGPHASDVRDDRPSWSPNGKRIAYESEVTNGSGQLDILVVNVENGGFINLTDTATAVEGKPVWSPDGKTIYYSSRPTMASPDDDILKEASDNSQAVPDFVLNSATAEYQPALSPDGTEMCFTRGPFGSVNADVYKVDLRDTTNQIDISDSAVGAYNCAWSPEGDKIAFVEGVFTSGALKYKNSDDTGLSSLLTSDTAQHFDGNPDWAPKRPAFCQNKPATIAGTDANDTLRGTRGKDVIQGHGRKDQINGRGDRDYMCGGRGNDKIRGGKDNDKLFGGPKNDRLYGEGGRDVLTGGPGRDVFTGGPGRDRCIGVKRKDIVRNC